MRIHIIFVQIKLGYARLGWKIANLDPIRHRYHFGLGMVMTGQIIVVIASSVVYCMTLDDYNW